MPASPRAFPLPGVKKLKRGATTGFSPGTPASGPAGKPTLPGVMTGKPGKPVGTPVASGKPGLPRGPVGGSPGLPAGGTPLPTPKAPVGI